MTIQLVAVALTALNVVVAGVAAYAALRAIRAANVSVEIGVLTRMHDAFTDVEHQTARLGMLAWEPRGRWSKGETVDAATIRSLQEVAREAQRSLARLGNDHVVDEYDRDGASFFALDIDRLVAADGQPVPPPDDQLLEMWGDFEAQLIDLSGAAAARAADIDREMAAILAQARRRWRRKDRATTKGG